jgi:hypothetical protein
VQCAPTDEEGCSKYARYQFQAARLSPKRTRIVRFQMQDAELGGPKIPECTIKTTIVSIAFSGRWVFKAWLETLKRRRHHSRNTASANRGTPPPASQTTPRPLSRSRCYPIHRSLLDSCCFRKRSRPYPRECLSYSDPARGCYSARHSVAHTRLHQLQL